MFAGASGVDHEDGMVHRDLKSSNLMITSNALQQDFDDLLLRLNAFFSFGVGPFIAQFTRKGPGDEENSHE